MRSFAWDDRGLQRTNPVYALRAILRDLEPHFLQNWEHTATRLGRTLHELAAEGVHLPPAVVEDWKRSGYLPAAFPALPGPPPPRVLGLVVKDGRDGLVLPLHAQEASGEGWPIDETLPFRAGPVLDLLVRLVRGAGFPPAGLLPERLAFAFANPLGHWAYGNSMTVAAVLAILDALGGRRAELLRGACAVVEPADGDSLASVRHIQPKLEAVRREYGGGSLLIAPSQCPELDEFRPHFAMIWDVADCHQLAARLAEAGLLQPLLEKVRLRRVELQRIHDRLRHLVQVTHAYAEAGDLGRRLQDCDPAEPVPLHLWDAIHGLEAEAARHQGRFLEAGARASHSSARARPRPFHQPRRASGGRRDLRRRPV